MNRMREAVYAMLRPLTGMRPCPVEVEEETCCCGDPDCRDGVRWSWPCGRNLGWWEWLRWRACVEHRKAGKRGWHWTPPRFTVYRAAGWWWRINLNRYPGVTIGVAVHLGLVVVGVKWRSSKPWRQLRRERRAERAYHRDGGRS